MTFFNPQRTFIFLFFTSAIALLIWSNFTKIDVIVRTEGQIIPAGKSQVVQHLEGGIIKKIYVSEGEVVKVGQPLIELSDIQTRSNLGQEQSKVDALRGREARLIAELNDYNSVQFPQALKEQNVIKVENSAFQARKAQLAEEIRILQAQGSQKKNELSEINSKKQHLVEELELAKKQLKVMDGLHKNNAASDLELLDAQTRVQKLKTQIAEATTAAPRIQAANLESESRVQEAIARFKAEASANLTQVREELQRSTHEIGTNVDRLERNIVRAPVTGLVNKMNITTVGAVIKPSELLMEITPSDQRIVFQTKANPNDRANLRRGLKAKVRIGAYDYSTYGSIDGIVSDVSADTISDERGNRFYRVNIEVDASGIFSGTHQKKNLIPGMAATADISVGKRSILSYILSPIFKFKDAAFHA